MILEKIKKRNKKNSKNKQKKRKLTIFWSTVSYFDFEPEVWHPRWYITRWWFMSIPVFGEWWSNILLTIVGNCLRLAMDLVNYVKKGDFLFFSIFSKYKYYTLLHI